ncbi:sulfurtransferase [Nitratireductor sp. XY-223]|uniref:sulfurtransferase n=1 Tax=Nitratireductor sp. XY-223 TaxID=2561926 RepID=UPI0010A9B092|nr:sulfurtransferase [Nitratireductor sp. XY-223]
MKTHMTRRTFGAFTGAAALALPRLTFAQPSAYANPQLLIEPGELMGMVSATQSAITAGGGADAIVIDVRPRDAFDEGHIPGARHLDPNAVAAEHSPVSGSLRPVAEIESLLGALGVAADRRIVFYDDRGGFHAARMLWLMEYLGHQNVAILNGGLTGWQSAGGPMTKDAARAFPARFQSAPSPRRHATAEDVLQHRDVPDGVLIDVRPPKMYDEGHIPWAINIPWSKNLGAASRFLPSDPLMAHFEAHGVTPAHDVMMHCQVGLASSHSYVALRLLGFPRVRVYHRSWAEWGGDPALPKATS